MDKNEFEKLKSEMQSELIKLFWDGMSVLKEELSIKDDKGEKEVKEDEHVNPETQVGDWIVFEEASAIDSCIVSGTPYQIEEGLKLYTTDGNFSRNYETVKRFKHRLATEREVMFAEAGRDVNEFKVEDVVVCYGKFGRIVGLRSDNSGRTIVFKPFNEYDLKQVYKDDLEVVCFYEDRKDVKI